MMRGSQSFPRCRRVGDGIVMLQRVLLVGACSSFLLLASCGLPASVKAKETTGKMRNIGFILASQRPEEVTDAYLDELGEEFSSLRDRRDAWGNPLQIEVLEPERKYEIRSFGRNGKSSDCCEAFVSDWNKDAVLVVEDEKVTWSQVWGRKEAGRLPCAESLFRRVPPPGASVPVDATRSPVTGRVRPTTPRLPRPHGCPHPRPRPPGCDDLPRGWTEAGHRPAASVRRRTLHAWDRAASPHRNRRPDAVPIAGESGYHGARPPSGCPRYARRCAVWTRPPRRGLGYPWALGTAAPQGARAPRPAIPRRLRYELAV